MLSWTRYLIFLGAFSPSKPHFPLIFEMTWRHLHRAPVHIRPYPISALRIPNLRANLSLRQKVLYFPLGLPKSRVCFFNPFLSPCCLIPNCLGKFLIQLSYQKNSHYGFDYPEPSCTGFFREHLPHSFKRCSKV